MNLDRNIKQLADFKVVMSTINNIQSTTLSIELKIREMQETYNVLEEHRIQVSFLKEEILISGNWEKENLQLILLSGDSSGSDFISSEKSCRKTFL